MAHRNHHHRSRSADMGNTFILYCVWLLLNQVKMISLSNDPYSDPVDDIPKINGGMLQVSTMDPDDLREQEEERRQKQELERIGKSDPELREQAEIALRRRNRIMFDFETVHDRNIQEQAMLPAVRPALPPPSRSNFGVNRDRNYDRISDFGPGTFDLHDDVLVFPKKKNWTTCEQFGRGSPMFVPEDVINIHWIPFYIWASVQQGYDSSPLTVITLATIKKVERYYEKYGRLNVNGTINWHKPKLLLSQPLHNWEALLIEGDKNGFYHMIIDMGLPDEERDVLNFALEIQIRSMCFKIFENYLGMMFCEATMAMLMAREGYEPPTKKDRRAIASRVKFRGRGRLLLRDLEEEKRIKQRLRMDEEDKKTGNKKTNVNNPDDDLVPYENSMLGRPTANKFWSGGGSKMEKGGWVPME